MTPIELKITKLYTVSKTEELVLLFSMTSPAPKFWQEEIEKNHEKLLEKIRGEGKELEGNPICDKYYMVTLDKKHILESIENSSEDSNTITLLVPMEKL